MTDLRKQVFQAIEQLAFHYQGDKDDLEMLIDVVVELIQKREAEARIDEVEKYNNHCAEEMAKLSGDYNINVSTSVLKAKGYGSPYAKVRLSQLKNEGKNTDKPKVEMWQAVPDNDVLIASGSVKMKIKDVKFPNEGKVKDE